MYSKDCTRVCWLAFCTSLPGCSTESYWFQGGEGSKKRISLSLRVGLINSGISAASVGPGTALPAAVKGVEDHGYTLSFGIKVWHWSKQTIGYLSHTTSLCVESEVALIPPKF